MSQRMRNKAPKPKQTNSPSVRLAELKHKSPSPSPHKQNKPEIKTVSQEVTETQKESKSGDSNGGSVPKHGFDTPEAEGTSQEFGKCESIKRICSPSYAVKKLKTIASSEKADRCEYSTQAGSDSFEVMREGNRVLSEQRQDCPDPQMMNSGQYQVKDSHLKECDSKGRVEPSSVEHEKQGVSFQKPEHSDDASREDSSLGEFKRLQQRCHELDNERAALTLAIGKEMGLTANIQQLHEYNTIKDITQIVIGSLSNMLSIPVTQLHYELNLSFEK